MARATRLQEAVHSPFMHTCKSQRRYFEGGRRANRQSAPPMRLMLPNKQNSALLHHSAREKHNALAVTSTR